MPSKRSFYSFKCFDRYSGQSRRKPCHVVGPELNVRMEELHNNLRLDEEKELGDGMENSKSSKTSLELQDRQLEVGNEVYADAEAQDDSAPFSNGVQNAAEKDGGEKLELSKTVSSTLSLAAQMSRTREALFVLIICMAQIMTQAGLGHCLAILHQIGDHFDVDDPSSLSWLIAGYSLTVGTFILISGRLGDIFGHKRLFLIGFAWFSLWSLVLGFSWWSNSILFIFARVLQGIGPAIILPNGLAILGTTYNPGPRKSMVFALFGACAPGGSVIGSVCASLFNLVFWPWTFFTFAIVLAIVGVAGYFVIPNPPRRRSPRNQSLYTKILEFDPLGAVTGVAALVLFNFAWNQAPIVGWNEPYVFVLLIISIFIFSLFIFVELRVTSHPLLPVQALSLDVIFVLGCVACGWGMFGIWAFYSWQFLEVLRGASPLLASAYISPVAISGALAAFTTGYLLERLRPAAVMVLAMTFFTIGIVLLATCPVDQVYWAQIFVCVIIIPWGMDMSFPAGTLILSNAVQKKHQGIAASLVTTVVNYSISLGLGFAGTVEVHVNNGGNTLEDILKGYRGAMYMGIGLAGLGLAIALIYLTKSHVSEKMAKRNSRELNDPV